MHDADWRDGTEGIPDKQPTPIERLRMAAVTLDSKIEGSWDARLAQTIREACDELEAGRGDESFRRVVPATPPASMSALEPIKERLRDVLTVLHSTGAYRPAVDMCLRLCDELETGESLPKTGDTTTSGEVASTKPPPASTSALERIAEEIARVSTSASGAPEFSAEAHENASRILSNPTNLAALVRGAMNGKERCMVWEAMQGLGIAYWEEAPFLRAIVERDECKCNMRQRMVGDGCDVCNPQRGD